MASLLLDWMLQPLGAVSVLLLLTLALLMLSGSPSRLAKLTALFATLVLWIAASPVPANTLLQSLEVASSGPASCQAATAMIDNPSASLPMVVPGGGMNAWRRSDNAYELLDEDTLRRVNRAVDLAREDSVFHVLGGGSNGRNLADLMASVLRDRGIAETRIVREPLSRSTRENAEALATLLPPSEHPTIHLVTSQLHLARATRWFEHAGYVVCGTGVASIASPSAGLVGWLPWLTALERTTLAWRELLATLAQRP